ncbi:MAG: hypothetical protein GY926_05845 [bacterium]|nr:hypothetical protein [bacterium]
MKKAQLNKKRRRAKGCPKSQPGELCEEVTADSGSIDSKFDAGIVTHLRVVVSLIEGLAVRREQIIAMLEKLRRQRRILQENQHDYLLRWLREHPP